MRAENFARSTEKIRQIEYRSISSQHDYGHVAGHVRKTQRYNTRFILLS